MGEEKELKYPNKLDPQAKDCLQKLFNRDPTKRLGVTSRVLDHRFFVDVLDVNGVINRRVDPPFIPRKQQDHFKSHTAYFDTEFTKTNINLSKVEKSPRQNEQRFFMDFEYTDDNLVRKYKNSS